MSRTLSSVLIHKVLKLVPLTATGPKVCVATSITLISYSYSSLLQTLNHIKSLKLKDHPGENVTDFCDAILVDAERLESAGSFNPKHIGYIIHIFEDTSDYKFELWATQKYNYVTEFIDKLCVCDKDVMQPDEIITYGELVKEAMREYHNLFDSNWWEPTNSKKQSKDETLLLKFYTVALEYPVNKKAEKVNFKSYHNGNGNKFGVGSSTNSVATCHKCSKKCHLKRNFISNRNGYDGKLS